MAERYTRVFTQQGQFYCPGAPVVIEAGALLKDNQTGKIIAQIKFKNISPKVVCALTVRISAKDVSGADVEGVDRFQYLDLNVRRDEEFGAKTPIVLPNAVARSFSCECVSAVFSDGTVWECEDDAVWTVLPAPVLLKNEIGAGLAEQYKRDTNSKAEYKVIDHADLWICACGATNSMHEGYCHACRVKKTTLHAVLNVDTLRANKKKYDDAVAAEQAELAEAERVRNAKNKKIGIIASAAVALLIAIVLLITKVVIPANDYKNANMLLNGGEFIAAEQAFKALADYKDSQTMVLECRYQRALALLQNDQYDEAYVIFKDLGTYSDAIEQTLACKHLQLLAYLDAQDFLEAQQITDELKSYQPTQDYLLQAVIDAINDKNYDIAYKTVDLLSEYGNEKTMAKEALYNQAIFYYDQKNYDQSNDIFTYLGEYKDSKEKIHTHNYSSTVVLEATCEVEGEQENKCTCGAVITTVIPAKGHTTNDGICQRCKADFRQLPATQNQLQGIWVSNRSDGRYVKFIISGDNVTYIYGLTGFGYHKLTGKLNLTKYGFYISGTSKLYDENGNYLDDEWEEKVYVYISKITSSYFVDTFDDEGPYKYNKQ